MQKEFIPHDIVRDGAIKLAHRMLADHFTPTIIYASLRGGTSLANVISEYYKLYTSESSPVLYAAVVAHSYNDVQKRSHVHIDGWTYDPARLRLTDRVLLIDDIFDSGLTINRLASIISAHGIKRENMVIAVHDYKIRTYETTELLYTPDYWCRRIEITRPEDDNWIHYLSHELVGLSEQEIALHYSNDSEVVALLKQVATE